MPTFTSTRERRLWTATLALLLGIGTAAVFAGRLVDRFGSEVLLGVAFGLGFLLTIAAVLGIGAGRRLRAEAWVTLGVAAVYLMIPVRSGVPAVERTHLFEYGLLAVLLYEALGERRANGAGFRFPGIAAIALATLCGWLDEALQGLVPTRVYDLRDVFINALAAVIAVAAIATLRWGRRGIAGRFGRTESGEGESSHVSPDSGPR
jgi:MFS family permease